MVRVILGHTCEATTSKISASPASTMVFASATSILGPTTRALPIVILESGVSATTIRLFLLSDEYPIPQEFSIAYIVRKRFNSLTSGSYYGFVGRSSTVMRTSATLGCQRA